MNRNTLRAWGVAAVVCAACLMPSVAVAAETETAPAPPVLQVQLDWFMMPVTTAKSKKTRTVPGTIFLKVETPDDVAPACVFEPRVRDAMLRVLFAHPMEVSRGTLKTDAVRPLLVQAANSVMEKKRVADVWVLFGIARAARGDLEKLPFDQVQLCRDVRAGEEKILEQKLKKEGE